MYKTCDQCNGCGHVEVIVVRCTIGCCGRPLRDNQCCGNGVPEQYQDVEADQCDKCVGTGVINS